MPKFSKKGYKKKYKTKFKKKYARKYGKKRKADINRKQIRVKGIKHKLNTKPEKKYTEIAYPTATLIPNGGVWLKVWDCNGTWMNLGGTQCIGGPLPASATNAGYIGQNFNSLYCELRIMLDPAVPLVANADLTDIVRVACIRPRIGQGAIVATPTFMQPWNTKAVDLMFEKYIKVQTGATLTPVGAAPYQSMRDPPTMYIWKIPLKETIFVNANGNMSYEYPVQIYMSSFSAQINVQSCFCKFIYIDN